MTHTFDEDRFRALWRDADEALGLTARAHEVFAQRPLQSFDGLGHLLDSILPDEPARVSRIASAVRLPGHFLERLRSSQLDPLTLPLEPLALLGRLLGVAPDALAALMQRDHERFEPFARGAVARAHAPADPEAALRALRDAWARVEADDATDL